MGNKLGYPEVDISGKVAVVTGGNSGIGYGTAKALARLGAHTFIACRSKERAEEAIERMKSEIAAQRAAPVKQGKSKKSGGASGESEPAEQVKSKEEPDLNKVVKVEFLPLDLSSFQSTVDFVCAFKAKKLPLHILINNAGIAFVPYKTTGDGYESQFQVNYLSHLLLTLELLPVLLDTAKTAEDIRIVNVSSYGHRSAQPFDSNRLNIPEPEYKRLQQYFNSKLFNVMGGFALQRRLAGKNITVSSLCPGIVKTQITRGFEDKKVMSIIQKGVMNAIGRNLDAGASTSLNCAVNPDLNSQKHLYYESCQPKQPSNDAMNESFQEELWKRSFEFLRDYLSPSTVETFGPKRAAEPTGATEATGAINS